MQFPCHITSNGDYWLLGNYTRGVITSTVVIRVPWRGEEVPPSEFIIFENQSTSNTLWVSSVLCYLWFLKIIILEFGVIPVSS